MSEGDGLEARSSEQNEMTDRSRLGLRRTADRLARRAQRAVGMDAVFAELQDLIVSARDLQERIERLEGHVEHLGGTQEGLHQTLSSTLHTLDETVRMVERVDEQTRMLDARLRADATRVTVLESRLEDVRSEHKSLQDSLAGVQALLAASRDRPSLWGLALEPFSDERAGQVYGFRDADLPPADKDGEAFPETLLDLFRAPSPVVHDRHRVYLELIGARDPVVEIGFGRGDFLDLLRDHDHRYVGVDSDPGMIAAARARGHRELVEDDANSYLGGVADGSVGAVFCSNLVEHLDASYLFRFIELISAKLKPAGIFIAETPNLHCPSAVKLFWADVTRRAPVFPEVALALCWTAGFRSAYVFHPGGSGDVDADRFVEPEFAVVATKQGAEKPAGSPEPTAPASDRDS